MELIPSEPPGNAKRKLRGLAEDIARLRDQGYSIRVIHDTLIRAGVQVSRATVHRELNRPSQMADKVKPATLQEHPKQAVPAAPAPQAAAASQAALGPPDEPIPPVVKPMSDVDAFFSRHISNPLFRSKGSS